MTVYRPDVAQPAHHRRVMTRAGITLLCAGALLAAPAATSAELARAEAAALADDAKSVFYSGTHDEALAEIDGTDRVLVLYFTAVWCGPCQQMQRTTWVDDRVVDRFTTGALVVKIDVDEQKQLAERYRVRAMPTMLALRGGKEVDRVVGMRTAEQMLGWMGTLQELQPGEVVQPAPVAEDDVNARYERARQHLMSGRSDDALREYLWLWDNIPVRAPEMLPVRNSFMVSEIRSLCSEHEPARVAFAQRRDQQLAKLQQPGWEVWDVAGFVALNDALGEPQATLRWYDSLKDDPANERMIGYASLQLVPLLMEDDRYAEAGRLISDPVQSAQRSFAGSLGSIRGLMDDEGGNAELVDMLLRDAAVRQAREVAALFAAERNNEATRVAAIVVKELGVMGREVLAEVAVNAGYAQPLHLRLLENIAEDERPEGYEQLVTKLREALAAQQG